MGVYWCFLCFVIACGFPAAVEGCTATPLIYGPTCNSGTSISGSPGLKIKYSINAAGSTKTCCKAHSCSGSSCGLGNIGCGSGSWSSSSLNWGNNNATPKMKCKGNFRGSAYSFSYSKIH